MTIKYKTADAFPCRIADMGSQDKKHPSFTVFSGYKIEGCDGPDVEGWYDIYSTAKSVTEPQIISLAKIYLGIDIEIESY